MLRNKKRQPNPTAQQLPAQKKRKIEKTKYYKVFQTQEEGEKRKSSDEQAPEAKRTRLDDQPVGRDVHPAGRDDQPGGRDDQPTGSTVQPAGRDDQPAGRGKD